MLQQVLVWICILLIIGMMSLLVVFLLLDLKDPARMYPKTSDKIWNWMINKIKFWE